MALPELLRCLVIGVHLDGERLVGIDELDEQWKLIAEALVVSFAHELVLQLGHDGAEGLAVVVATVDGGLTTLHAGNLPALTDICQVGSKVFERYNLLAAPKGLFQKRLKTECFHKKLKWVVSILFV